eukprot:scaffold221_cov249-Pinguiococcus_pyrenoidosus.AAC.1
MIESADLAEEPEPFFSTHADKAERALYPCRFCGLSCHSKSGIARHLPKCRKNPTSVRYENASRVGETQTFIFPEPLSSSTQASEAGAVVGSSLPPGHRRFAVFLTPQWRESVHRSLREQPELARRIASGQSTGFRVLDMGDAAVVTSRAKERDQSEGQGTERATQHQSGQQRQKEERANEEGQSEDPPKAVAEEVTIKSSHLMRPEALACLPTAELPESYLYRGLDVYDVPNANNPELSIRAKETPFPPAVLRKMSSSEAPGAEVEAEVELAREVVAGPRTGAPSPPPPPSS